MIFSKHNMPYEGQTVYKPSFNREQPVTTFTYTDYYKYAVYDSVLSDSYEEARDITLNFFKEFDKDL